MELLLGHPQSLIPYGILLLLFVLFCFAGELLRNRVADFAIVSLLLVFAGFREAITPDLQRYRDLYEGIAGGNQIEIEPTFSVISRLLSSIGLDYHALFFVYTLVTILCIYWAVRNFTVHARMALLLYVLIPFCLLNLFVEMRESAAVSVVLLAVSLLGIECRHRKLKIILLACLSFLFHFTALIFWLIFILGWKFVKRKHGFPIQAIFITASVLIPTSAVIAAIHVAAYPFLPGKYQMYINTFLLAEASLAESGQLLKSVIYSALAVFFAFWLSRQERPNGSQIPVNLFIVGVILLNITRSFAELSRVSYFFLIFQIVIIPQMFVELKNNRKLLLGAYSVLLFYFAQFIWGISFYSEEVGDYVFLHYRNLLFPL